jgi:hypothetical protein
MAERCRWYFYNGRVPVPVTLPDGRVFSVRPRGHVYTELDSIRKYGDKFRPCAPPENAGSILTLLAIKPELPPSQEALKASAGPLATSIVELGLSVGGSPVPEPPSAIAEDASVADSPKGSRIRRSTAVASPESEA